tara:strand:- start:1670 stop:2674 length:1005 start_codon:yes stop_codon:yes gene_type:complete
MAKLPTVEQMKFRKYPPLRSGPPILWPTNRYFRRNEGTTDYATIPEVTLAGDFVVDVLALFTGTTMVMFGSTANFFTTARINADGSIRWRPVANSSDVLTAAGIVNLNELTLLSFSRTGSTVEIKANGTSVAIGGTSAEAISFNALFNSGGSVGAGILANLKIYDNGTLVRDYPINDNSSTIRDLANGQDGTIINGNADDWGLFDRQANGDWLGQELVVNGGFDDGLGGWLQTGSSWQAVSGSAEKTSGASFLYQTNVADIGINASVSLYISEISGGSLAISLSDGGTTESFDSVGQKNIEGEITKNQSVYFSGGDIALITIDNVSIKEVLKNA